MKRLLAMSLVVLSSFAYGQTSTATAPDANKLVYKGAPAWSLSSNRTGVTILYIDGTSEKIPWNKPDLAKFQSSRRYSVNRAVAFIVVFLVLPLILHLFVLQIMDSPC
jgi:hypothetical protein